MAIIKQGMSAEHIANNLSVYESARTGFFELTVFFTKSLIRAAYTGEKDDATDSDKISAADATEAIKLAVEKAPIPDFKVTKLSYRIGNEVINSAGVPEFSDVPITVRDYVGQPVRDTLLAWKAACYNVHTRKGGRMADYKFNGEVTEYTQDGIALRSWRLIGLWCNEVNADDGDKSNDDLRKINANLVVDRVIPVDID